ncbi:MAG: hypothetical protein ACLVJK_05725 [Alistipes putredinis]
MPFILRRWWAFLRRRTPISPSATEKIFLAPIRLAVQPEVKELTMPVFGTAHNLAVVSIDRRYRGQAHKAAQGLWGPGR